jgi:MFS family permease
MPEVDEGNASAGPIAPFRPRCPERTPDQGRSVDARRDLAAIVGDGVAYSLMVGLGETYLSAFVLFLGLSAVSSGLIVALPMLGGALLQLAAPWGVRRLGSYRRWVVSCAIVQAASLLALVAAEALAGWAGTVAMMAATVYWGSGLATGPAWNAWVEEIVPRPIRARFFGRRARLCQIAVLLGFVAGGALLHVGAAEGRSSGAFATVFAAAAVCRFLSAWFLSRQTEPASCRRPEPALSFRAIRGRLRDHAAARLLAYLFAAQAAVQISGPFYTPFMLRELRLSFVEYTALVALAFVAKAATSPLYGRLVQRIGAKGLLWIGGAGIVPVAGLWVVSHSFPYLVAVQILSGAAWAAFDLAMLLIFFDAVPRARRTSVLSLFNLGNAASTVTGAMIGGGLLTLAGQDAGAYLWLFGLSSVGRAVSLVLLAGVPATAGIATAATRSIAVRPVPVDVDRPLLPTLGGERTRRAA